MWTTVQWEFVNESFQASYLTRLLVFDWRERDVLYYCLAYHYVLEIDFNVVLKYLFQGQFPRGSQKPPFLSLLCDSLVRESLDFLEQKL